MSDAALATITEEAIALPYEEQKRLLDSLTVSVRRMETEQNADAAREERIKRRLAALEKYQGCMGGLWANDDPLEYQRRLREEREIG